MKDSSETQTQPLRELAELRRQIAELEHADLERRRMELKLQASETKFRTLVEQIMAVTYIDAIDEFSSTLYISPQVETMLGYSTAEWLADPTLWTRILYPDDRERVLAEDSRSNITGEPFCIEYRLVARDGRVVWLYDQATLMRDETGQPHTWQGVMHDITERKQAEEQVQKLNQDLTRHARELVALNNASRAMTSSLDLHQVLGVVMFEVRSLLGAEGASLLLREGDDFVFVAADSPGAEVLAGTRMPVTAGIAGAVLQEKQVIRLSDAQSDPRFYSRIDMATGLTTRSLLAVPLVFKGEIQGVLEAINKAGGAFDEQDVELLQAIAGSAAIAIANARLYQAEREQYRRLQISQAKLIQAEKMEALGRLIASIAHEINNPLQALLGCLELFREELESSARRDKLLRYLGIVEAETEHIAAIVRRVRDFYRPARKEMQPTDVHTVLNSVLELSGKQMQNNDVTVEREWTDGLPWVQANPDHLKQVFLNLVLNAVDAMARRGGTLCVRTSMDQIHRTDGPSQPAVRIEFADTGEGMLPEILANLFEPFYTTRASGTGLGLAISYEIIQAHRGQITATSQLQVGTTFTILLPID